MQKNGCIETQFHENDEINNPLSTEEVGCAIKYLRINKSAGIDGMLNEFIIQGSHKMYLIITNVFNLILHSGVIPVD